MPENLTAPQRQSLENLLYEGRKIEAIKLYRQATGGDLRDAKQAVDAFESQLRQQWPQRFVARKAGCGTAAVIFLLFMLTWCWMIVSSGTY